jgi:malate/lactate dehydrogenase
VRTGRRQKELGDIVLLDIPDKEGVAKGKMLDLACCGPIERFDGRSPARATTRTSPARTSSSSPRACPASPA